MILFLEEIIFFDEVLIIELEEVGVKADFFRFLNILIFSLKLLS